MSGTTYLPQPQNIIVTGTESYLIKVKPVPVPTLISYNYYDQTVVVVSIHQGTQTLTATFNSNLLVD